MHNEERIKQLLEHRAAHLAYLNAKTIAEDWHGVSDAANDLREIDLELKLWRELPEKIAIDNGRMMSVAARRHTEQFEAVGKLMGELAATAMSAAHEQKAISVADNLPEKPATQTIEVPPTDFFKPHETRDPDAMLHELFSDYGFQQYIIGRFGPSPNDDDYAWVTKCVRENCRSGADLDAMVADWKKP